MPYDTITNMEPNASNKAPQTKQDGDSSNNVSDIDRELEAYLEEKRGKGDQNVDSQLAELQLKREKKDDSGTQKKQKHAAGSKANNEAYTQPMLKRSKAPQEPQQQPQQQQQTPQHTNKEEAGKQPAQSKGGNNSRESFIRALEKKYAASNAEANSASQYGQATTQAHTRKQEDRRKHGEQASQPTPSKEARQDKQDKKQDKEAAKTQFKPTEPTRHTETLKGSLTEPYSEELTKALKLLDGMSREEAQDIVTVFEPKFARNKERKELYEKTKRELETELLERVTQTTKNKEEKEKKREAPASTLEKQSSGKDTSSQQEDSNIEASRSSKDGAGSAAVKAEPAREQERDTGDKERKDATPDASSATATSSSSPKRAVTDTSKSSRAVESAQVQSSSTQQQASAAEQKPRSRIERVKHYAQKRDLLTTLVYDPQKGFVRASAFDAPETTIEVDVDEQHDTAHVKAHNSQGTVVAQAEVSLSDLA